MWGCFKKCVAEQSYGWSLFGGRVFWNQPVAFSVNMFFHELFRAPYRHEATFRDISILSSIISLGAAGAQETWSKNRPKSREMKGKLILLLNVQRQMQKRRKPEKLESGVGRKDPAGRGENEAKEQQWGKKGGQFRKAGSASAPWQRSGWPT